MNEATKAAEVVTVTLASSRMDLLMTPGAGGHLYDVVNHIMAKNAAGAQVLREEMIKLVMMISKLEKSVGLQFASIWLGALQPWIWIVYSSSSSQALTPVT